MLGCLWTNPAVNIFHIHRLCLRLGRARILGWPVWSHILGSGLAESLDSFAELLSYRELTNRSLGPVRTLGLGLGTRSSYRLGLGPSLCLARVSLCSLHGRFPGCLRWVILCRILQGGPISILRPPPLQVMLDWDELWFRGGLSEIPLGIVGVPTHGRRVLQVGLLYFYHLWLGGRSPKGSRGWRPGYRCLQRPQILL